MRTKRDTRLACTSIENQIICGFAPAGVRISGKFEDIDGHVNLEQDQKLEIFNAMCRKARKTEGSTIYECIVELKNRYLENFMDFIDRYRTGAPARTFDDWNEFKSYTLRKGRRIDLEMAKNNMFLAPLLQDLSKSPNAVNPIAVMRRIEDELAAEREERQHETEQARKRKQERSQQREHATTLETLLEATASNLGFSRSLLSTASESDGNSAGCLSLTSYPSSLLEFDADRNSSGYSSPAPESSSPLATNADHISYSCRSPVSSPSSPNLHLFK